MSDTIILQRLIPHYRQPLFKALHERFGWLTVAASNPPGGTFLKTDGEIGAHVRAFPFAFPDPGNAYSCRMPLDRIVAELRPKRIISEFSMRMNAPYRLPLLRAAGRIDSYALWSHGWNMDRGLSSFSGRFVNTMRLAPMLFADMLLTYTEEGKAWLDRRLPWKKVVAIGNTLDIDAMARAAAGARAVRSGEPQLLAVGRLTQDKKFGQLIETFRSVRRELPQAALTIIGDGPDRARLEAMAGPGNGVRFLGPLYDEAELAPHFTGADFLVLTGAAGLSVNHALAYHLPILAYRRGPDGPFHHPEIAYVEHGETGLFAQDHSQAAMAGLIIAAHRAGRAAELRAKIPAILDRKLRLSNIVENFARVDAAL